MHKCASTFGIIFIALVLSAAAPGPKPPISAAVESLSISNVTPDHLELRVTLAISAMVHLKLDDVRFEQVRLDSLPVYIAPMRETIELDRGAARSVPLGPIVVYYRDLERLDPVRRIVGEQSARLNGLARIHVEISPLQKFFIGPNLRVLAPLHQNVRVVLPGGAPARETALAALAAADAAIRVGHETIDNIRQRFGWTDDLIKQYSHSLLVIETHYRVGGTARTVRGVGFVIPGNRFMTTAELVQPWLYDPEVAQLLQSGAVLDHSSYDVRVLPAGLSLKNNQLRVVDPGGGTEKVFVTIGTKLHNVELGQREFDRNIAIVEFAQPPANAPPIHPTPTSARQWDYAALFRPRAGSPANLEVIHARARRTGNRIELLEPTDSSAFGSPLIVSEGVIGIVQSESTAAMIGNCCK